MLSARSKAVVYSVTDGSLHRELSGRQPKEFWPGTAYLLRNPTLGPRNPVHLL